jgi:hypothetical protein
LSLSSILSSRPAIISDKNKSKFEVKTVETNIDYQLKLSQLYDLIAQMDVMRDGGIMDTNSIRKIIDSMVIDTLIGLEANNIDINNHIAEKQILRNFYYSHLASEFYEDQIYSKIKIDSQKVEQFFFNSTHIFGVLKTIKYYDILINPDRIKSGSDSLRFKDMTEKQFNEDVEDYVQEIRNSINGYDDFQNASLRYSIDTSIFRIDMLVGFGSKYKIGGIGIIDSVAFDLKVDSISEPFKDQNGWHIIYINEIIKDEVQPLPPWIYDMAVDKYKESEASKIGSSLLDSLLNSIELEYNEELFDKDLLSVSGLTWIAVVNGEDTIYVNEARAHDASYKKKYKVEITDAPMKRGYLKIIARKYVIIQEARKSGIEDNPKVINKKKEYQHIITRKIVSKKLFDRTWAPKDSLVEEYYDKNKETFIEDKPLKVQHIVTNDSLFGEELRNKALSGENFLQLAEEHYPGIKSIRRELADLGNVGQNDVPIEFYNVANNLKIGEISHPVKTRYGYHIIKLLDRKKIKDFQQVRAKIFSILKIQHNKKLKNKFEDDLKIKYNVKYVGELYPIQLKPLVDRKNK